MLDEKTAFQRTAGLFEEAGLRTQLIPTYADALLALRDTEIAARLREAGFEEAAALIQPDPDLVDAAWGEEPGTETAEDAAPDGPPPRIKVYVGMASVAGSTETYELGSEDPRRVAPHVGGREVRGHAADRPALCGQRRPGRMGRGRMSPLSPMERRPAPVDNTVKSSVPHGAPALWEGELAALYRDASFLNSPDTRTDKQAHVPVFSTALTTSSGGLVGGFGAACDPGRIMLNEDLIFVACEVGKPARCRRRACEALFHAAERHDSDLEHIRSYYGLERRIGVRVALGLRVRHVGRPGVIIDTSGQYLILRLEGEPHLVTAHATSSMEYQGPDGWVPAVPLPDPYAAASR